MLKRFRVCVTHSAQTLDLLPNLQSSLLTALVDKVDETVRGRVVRGDGASRPNLWQDLRGQDLAELHPPLVERADVPDNTLSKKFGQIDSSVSTWTVDNLQHKFSTRFMIYPCATPQRCKMTQEIGSENTLGKGGGGRGLT